MQESIRFADIEPIIRETLDMGKSFRLEPFGSSMHPTIREGVDAVYIKKPSGRIKKYDIAFYKRDNGAFILHRVIKATKAGYILCGDNQFIPEHGISDRHIIGVVTEIERDGRLILAESPEFSAEAKKIVKNRLKGHRLAISLYHIKSAIKKITGRA